MRSGFLLLLAAFIWGIAFVAQSVGMDYMGPCTFNAARFFIGGIVLLPVIWTKERMEAKKVATGAPAKKKKFGALLPGGVCCGIALCAASLLQQFGIRYTSVGKAGFLTTLYIVIVPLLGIFVRRMPGVKVWCSVVVALSGMYLLCISGSVRIGLGDALVIGLSLIHIFAGPCAMTQVGMIDGEFIINPSQEQWKKGDLQLTVASTSEKVIMIEAGANEVPEAVMIDAIYRCG